MRGHVESRIISPCTATVASTSSVVIYKVVSTRFNTSAVIVTSMERQGCRETLSCLGKEGTVFASWVRCVHNMENAKINQETVYQLKFGLVPVLLCNQSTST